MATVFYFDSDAAALAGGHLFTEVCLAQVSVGSIACQFTVPDLY